MGVIYYAIDLVHKTRFELGKYASSYRDIERGPLTLHEVESLGAPTGGELTQEHWRAVSGWLFAFCEYAGWQVKLVDDCSADFDDEWWRWPVVMTRYLESE